MSVPPSVPPGWYADPAAPAAYVRWYDGRQWTQHLQPAQPWSGPVTTLVPGQRGLGESPDDPTHWLLPTGRSGWAIAAGYVALFALVLWPLGPVAAGLGWRALVVADRDGSHGRGRAIFGIVVGIVSTILLLLLLIGALSF